MGLRSYQPVNSAAVIVDNEVKEIIEGTDESVKQIIDESKNLKLGDDLVRTFSTISNLFFSF